MPEPLPLTDVTVACTLPVGEVPDRLAAWRRIADLALRSERTPAGLRLSLPADPDLAAEVAGLAAREQQCCAFFSFRLDLPAPGELVLEIGAPPDAVGLVAELLTPGQPLS